MNVKPTRGFWEGHDCGEWGYKGGTWGNGFCYGCTFGVGVCIKDLGWKGIIRIEWMCAGSYWVVEVLEWSCWDGFCVLGVPVVGCGCIKSE